MKILACIVFGSLLFACGDDAEKSSTADAGAPDAAAVETDAAAATDSGEKDTLVVDDVEPVSVD